MLAHSFLNDLPACYSLSAALEKSSAQALPNDWFVIVTDIVNSTQAIEKGKYKEVNTVGVCSIVAVLNSLKKEVIPYVFGGDGASFCIPPHYLDTVIEALRGCQQFSQESFQLELRVGVVPYTKVQENAPIYISKFIKSDYLMQSIFTGGGLSHADKMIKQDSSLLIEPLNEHHQVDFSGFECRWNEIKSQQDFTISLLVQLNTSKNSYNSHEDLHSLKTLLEQIERILGNEDIHHPVSKDKLQLTLNPLKLLAEAKSKIFNKDKNTIFVLSSLLMQAIIGKILMLFSMRTGEANWGEYKDDFIQNSDYKKIDDVLRMTFSLNQKELHTLEAFLNQAYESKTLFYGIHKTDSALVTCMIEKTGEKHMHFIDANHGGYALAAKQLKHQLKHS